MVIPQLLQTKLRHPVLRHGLVPRARIVQMLSTARTAGLVLVSAPAGFGKTTLVGSALREESSVAWVSLDARDGDPARFWAYALQALESVSPGCASMALAQLETVGSTWESVVATLVNELSVRADDITLVLDDYHLCETLEVSAGMTLLLEHRPPQLRVVISTRADPALPLSRLRARGELVELRAADLRFTTEEVDHYLNGTHGLRLSSDELMSLETRTEGWVAALQLAALSLRDHADTGAFIANFAGTDRYVVDYLVDEVLEQQTPEVREFLLNTSALDRLSGPLCDAVAGNPGGTSSSQVLEMLERRNLLLVPLDDHRRWYRYHHLFADVLRARLLAERSDDLPALHQRASTWFEQAGDLESAVRHAFSSGDHGRAADLLEVAAPELRRRRAEGALRTWLLQLPPEALTQRPVLASHFIGALMASNTFEGVAARLDALQETLVTAPESLLIRDRAEWERLPAVVETHRAALALVSGDADEATSRADEALMQAQPSDRLTVASAAAVKGLASWTRGDLQAALEGYLLAADGMTSVGYISDARACTITIVDLQLQLGELDAAERSARRALELSQGRSHESARERLFRGSADMWVALATVAWERGDADGAASHLAVAGNLGEEAGLPQNPYRWRVAMAKLRELQGDSSAASTLLAEAEQLFNSDFSPNARPMPAVRARLAIRSGDLAGGWRWATAANLTATDDLTYLREYEHLTLVRLLVADHLTTGDPARLEEATRLLRRLHVAATSGGRTRTLLETSLLLTVAADVAGRTTEALEWLERAVELARPQLWLRPFMDEGAQVVRLLRRLPDGAGIADAVRSAGSNAPTAGEPANVGPGAVQRDALVAPLSRRELDVLRLLASDLDGPAIARHLNVSLPTVRTHTQRIYTKLGVNNRRAAVRRGHQLNL